MSKEQVRKPVLRPLSGGEQRALRDLAYVFEAAAASKATPNTNLSRDGGRIGGLLRFLADGKGGWGLAEQELPKFIPAARTILRDVTQKLHDAGDCPAEYKPAFKKLLGLLPEETQD